MPEEEKEAAEEQLWRSAHVCVTHGDQLTVYYIERVYR